MKESERYGVGEGTRMLPDIRRVNESRHADANRRYRARLRGEDAPLQKRRWIPAETADLIAAYRKHADDKTGWLVRLARRMKRHPANLVRKAKALGIRTDQHRGSVPEQARLNLYDPVNLSDEQRLKVGERFKRSHARQGHPRGMLGKHHTPEVCQRIGQAHLGRTLPPFSDERRRAISERTQQRLRDNPESFARNARRGKGGRRSDLGNQFFRSTYEANYARFLNFVKEPWEYEPKTFWFEAIRRGCRSYTPDFFLLAKNEYHEVKGWMDPKSQTKLKRMKKYYPGETIVLIDGAWFKDANRKGLCRLIPGWECGHKSHATTILPVQ